MSKDKFKKKLIQKAMGYDYEEVCEEYVLEDGEMKLSKRKVNKKHCPADNTALRVLLDEKESLSDLSEEDLKKERERIIEELINRGNK